MIKLQIIGHLGRDCEVKEISGRNVINFSVAHTEKFKDSTGNLQSRTTWVDCAYWSDRTAIAPYLLKGQLVFVEGSPEADAYTNKEGKAAATLRLRVRDIQLLGGKTDNNNSSSSQQEYASGNSEATGNSESKSKVSEPANESDDLPF